METLDVLLVYAHHEGNRTLSYQRGWSEHFRDHPRFDCTPLDVYAKGLGRIRKLTAPARSFDGVILLHSIFSNTRTLRGRLYERIRSIDAPTAFFIGNEYKLMPEKMDFAEDLDIDLLVSQGHSKRVHTLYRDRLDCEVVSIPSAGLDPELFQPEIPRSERPIDVGYRAYEGPKYLGHDERTKIAEGFEKHALSNGLVTDISTDPTDRFDRHGWADFLNRCKAQLGTEAGTDYFELSDDTRKKVNDYVNDHADPSFEDVYDRFFADYGDNVPMRMFTGRNVEAAGTKTVQILFEGEYGGYFEPDEHYIPLKKDFSNIDEVLEKFRDDDYCQRIIDNAYSLVHEELTYEALIDRFWYAFEPILYAERV